MTDMYIVFLNTRPVSGMEKIYLKLFNPTHCWLPNNPLAGINFWNAIIIPAIGI